MYRWRNTVNDLTAQNNKLNANLINYQAQNATLRGQLNQYTIENDDLNQRLDKENAYVRDSYLTHLTDVRTHLTDAQQIAADKAVMTNLNASLRTDEALLRKDEASIADLNASLQTALASQNAELDAEIEYVETRNLLNFKSSEYQRLQIGYLESLIYVCKFAYLALFLLALGLVAYKAQLRAASNLCALAFFFLFPFCVLYLEIILTNVCIWILSFATGSVYLPVQTHFNNATSQYKGAAALTAAQEI